LKVLLSIGGSNYSTNFSSFINTVSGRAVFTLTALELLTTYGFDGIDINWEYPADEIQAGALVLLLKELRQVLDEYGNGLTEQYHFALTFASPGGSAKYQILNLSEMDQYLDFWNLMAFDYTGPWSNITGHQANLFYAGNSTTPFDTTTAVDFYTSKGVASSKIVLGMPLYGRSFNQTTGLGSPFTGSSTYDFAELPIPGATEVYDQDIGASYSWDSARKELVSYDNLESARQKASWIQAKQLGGGMWWEGSADKNGTQSLIYNVVEVFGDSIQQSPNNLEYPDSLYENVRDLKSISELALYSTTTVIDTSTLQIPTALWTNSSNTSISPSTTTTVITTSSIMAASPLPAPECMDGVYDCESFVRLECPDGDCACGLDTTGHATCFYDAGCDGLSQCSVDSDCGSSETCIIQGCCGIAICAKLAQGCASRVPAKETQDYCGLKGRNQQVTGVIKLVGNIGLCPE